jgi:hypothetical protein
MGIEFAQNFVNTAEFKLLQQRETYYKLDLWKTWWDVLQQKSAGIYCRKTWAEKEQWSRSVVKKFTLTDFQ